MKINVNDRLYGFVTYSVENIPDVNATLIDMRHEKSGARLLILDRQDENATFTIGFKTTPTDDTGVFHILEHSVLCGSKKFPIKDPFAELSKGSIYTYLNALTAGDKTLYPVASKNPKAFYGLVDVYLDAVFNPLVLENPFIFMQEGHRCELNESDELTVTGVVYNEMKGVFATADSFADYAISKRVCPNSTYSYDAGGHPDHITDLTYEDFKLAYEKFYHPSNAYLFLDGDVNLPELLPLFDSYLSAYDKKDCHVAVNDGDAPLTEVEVGTYPIEAGEGTKDKTKVYLCYNTFRHGDNRNNVISLITEALADVNTAPLTKRILDTGLCESFSFFSTNSYSLNSLNVFFSGVKDGEEENVVRAFDEAIADIIENGIPRDIVSAALTRREFKIREADYGTYPKGMVYMRAIMTSAMFDESLSDSLCYEKDIKELCEKLNTDYYEDTLRTVLSSPRATVILHPDPSFNEKKEQQRNERLAKILADMTEEQKEALIKTSEQFHEWQKTPDTAEALKALPTLSVDDLNTLPPNTPIEVVAHEGSEILLHPIYTGGVSYALMYFDVSDVDEDELHYLGLFADHAFEWDTEKYSANEFQSKTKAHLGSFAPGFKHIYRNGEAKFYISLKLSCLDNEKDTAVSLVNEYLYHTLFNDEDTVKQNVKQLYTYTAEDIAISGHNYANMRCAAKFSVQDAIIEHISGYEYLSFLKELSSRIDECASDVLKRFEDITKKYFTRERLIVSVTESDGLDFAKRLVEAVRGGGEKCGKSIIKTIDATNEGIAVPVGVSFASTAGKFDDTYTGAMSVFTSIAIHELLWNEIRLKNGAYDTSFYIRPNGIVGCHAYRDPSPALSLKYYSHICNAMEEYLDTSPDVYKHIIGIFGASDTITTPRIDGANATSRYLSGLTYEDIVKRRKQCLETTVDELKRLNGIIKDALCKTSFTVVGPREELEKINGIDRILEI